MLPLFPRGLAITDFNMEDEHSSSALPVRPPQQHSENASPTPTPIPADPQQEARGTYQQPNGEARSSTSSPPVEDRPAARRSKDRPKYELHDEPNAQYPRAKPANDEQPSHTYPAGAAAPRPNEQYSYNDSFFPSSFASSDMPNGRPPAGSSAQQDSTTTPAQALQNTWQQSTQRDDAYRMPSKRYQPAAGPSQLLPSMSGSPPAQYATIPVSPKMRAQPQQPTYITPAAAAPSAANPVFAPVPMEEVCVECAMRDQDMADVDVTSPGVWERESDVYYDELVRREHEEAAAGVAPSDPDRPRARGGRLTEQNIKLWLSMNPREPASKRQNLDHYIRSQRSLLEAEAWAHARAVQESRQIDDKMRDTYSQLRRSTYELGGSSITAVDDVNGVRIKAPRSSTIASTGMSGSREVTLLENGMIVEHVDVKKEEREERERRRKEQKRARKSSRSSAYDVASIYSATSPLPHTDSGFHLGVSPNNRYSQSRSPRPSSTLTAPVEYMSPMMPQTYSTPSISDMQSSMSPSPNRRTRFFGFRNFSNGWRSQDSLAPSGFSGSMVDMHVALQREHARPQAHHSSVDIVGSAPSLGGWRHSSVLSPLRPEPDKAEEKPKKKRKGLAKIWRLVTGSSSKNDRTIDQTQTRSLDRVHGDEHDFPLTPPPPLSYLVSRSTGEQGASALRHVSTPSLPSSASPNNALSSVGVSPPTAPSSLVPSPTSSRPMAPDSMDTRKNSLPIDYDGEHFPPVEEESGQTLPVRGVHPYTSEPDIRRSTQSAINLAEAPSVPRGYANGGPRPYSVMTWRDKSLPPLPAEHGIRFPVQAQHDARARTLFYDPSHMPHSEQPLVAPQAPFRQAEARRQSFGGMGSKPPLQIHTMPSSRPTTGASQYVDPGLPVTHHYNEFGIARRSAGPLDGSKHNQPAQTQTTPGKRRSKFGLSSLLGRKSQCHDRESTVDVPVTRSSGSEARHEALMNEMGSSGSGHASFPRMSVTSRKNIDQLVDQAPDFVAYRYPSNDQNMNLLR
ncbi:hypothetical protein EWM64_g1206 [Hericium alpestre]|uniref:Uncharacterized protein n=1 Tax=Hericium alpestre TaxID=135208 RepID=A0A4Z0A8Z0_9AGAM|nr:hypothetical protein EWM64_g1206 [Hericium alpestre]